MDNESKQIEWIFLYEPSSSSIAEGYDLISAINPNEMTPKGFKSKSTKYNEFKASII